MPSPASGRLALGAVRTEDLEVDAVGDRHHAVGVDAGVDVHPAHELARHPQLVDVGVQRGEPVLRDRAELPRLDDRQPARAGGAEVRRPLVAHLDVRGVDQRRGRADLGGIAVDALHRAAQAAGDPVVDDRQARGQAVVALPAHRDVLGGRVAVHAGRAGAPVVGLELVDVGGEGAGLGDAGLELLEQARLGGEAVERAREVVDVEAVEDEAVDPVADGLRQAAEARDEHRDPRGQALGGGQRRAVPPHRRQRDRVDAAQQPADLGGREGAAQLDDAAAIERPELLGEAVGHLAEDLDVQPRLGPLRRLDQQLWPLVRIGRAQEGDGEVLGDAAGPAVAADLLPDLGVVGHGLADGVDQVGRVAGVDQGAPDRVGHRQDRGEAALGAGADLGEPAPVRRRRRGCRRTRRRRCRPPARRRSRPCR